jgi:uncharacterized protein (DUF2267 family)
MSKTGMDTFDTTVQKSEQWLKEIQEEMGWEDDRKKAVKVLRSVLHALRDRLTIDEGAHFSAQLPMLIRGLFYENWRPAEIPIKYRSREEFISLVASEFRNDPTIDIEKAAEAVFKTIKSQISAGESQRIEDLLPSEIKKMWTVPV